MNMHGYMIAAAFSLALAACHTPPPAPVEDRSARQYRLSEDGLYRVRKGDTLYSIAFNFGLDWKDVARWNGVSRPYTIWPGQELRLVAPAAPQAAQTGITTRAMGKSPTATTRPAENPPAPASAPASPAPDATPPVQARADPPPDIPPKTAGPLQDPDSWLWPTPGPVISTFSAGDPARKGIDIGGVEGQNIVAAATGDVVYSGSGLIGFGELIIIKHSDSKLTAYAHNRRRLVQEGERVAAGSQIAEMGQNDKEITMLHFELRVDGKPVDPLKYLPTR